MLIECEQCHKTFERHVSYVRRLSAAGYRMFCGRECSGLAKRRGDSPRKTMAAPVLHDGSRTDSVTADLVRELFTYDADSGRLHRVVRAGNRPAGSEVGRVAADGYRNVVIGGKCYKAHRIIWLMITGAWPPIHLDHINGCRDDNRWDNLRCVTREVNQQNQTRPQRGNKTGFLGVTRTRHGKFAAMIGHSIGKKTWLGAFATAEEAYAAYLAAKREMHPGCTI